MKARVWVGLISLVLVGVGIYIYSAKNDGKLSIFQGGDSSEKLGKPSMESKHAQTRLRKQVERPHAALYKLDLTKTPESMSEQELTDTIKAVENIIDSESVVAKVNDNVYSPEEITQVKNLFLYHNKLTAHQMKDVVADIENDLKEIEEKYKKD